MSKIPELFGTMVFNDKTMKERLPKETYKALRKTIKEGKRLDPSVTNIVASVMKDWAVENGATHFTHWFQPMTGITAEKHDSFLSPDGEGSVIMEFTGKDLVKGEPDASSFPSGGLRATFEARGYTAWDPTSYAFIKGNTLCIPTAFCSYSGEALDKKTPLLKSMEVINKQALRILRLFGNTTATRVDSTVGAEQEYFLIDKDMYDKRRDLVYCGRTLFGARSPKDQQKDDHYFGTLKPRVQAFMADLDEELWKLGVYAKTEHNEVAPDQNQLTMEYLKTVANRHGMACLLHEKPFAMINGSGKHNNWSLSTNTGENLLNPGKTPEENAQFLLFLTAVIVAVDKHQDLLRISVASAGNDHRLGASEAPPAIISMFLGEELTDILMALEHNEIYVREDASELKIGAKVLPTFFRDTTDRNRTSPFAFTGNKFEFRMLGSTFSLACPNIMLNTIVAETLDDFATKLENAKDFDAELNSILKTSLKEHERIIFNGNNYSDEWVEEAEKRGLLNLKTTADALPYYISKKNIDLFTKYGIYTESEVHSRYEIVLEEYSKTINIEAMTMSEMVKKDIIPAIMAYVSELSETAANKKAISPDLASDFEVSMIQRLSLMTKVLYDKVAALDEALIAVREIEDIAENAKSYKNDILPIMQEIRATADEAELIVAKKYWPFPTYGDLLFSVQ